jgi:hypothetical protein
MARTHGNSDALPKQVQDQINQANAIIDAMGGEPEKVEAPEEQVEAPKKEVVSEPDPEHKYRVLQGKYNKEVPRLQEDLRNTRSENADLRQRLNNLEATLSTIQAVKEDELKKASLPTITDDEREQFGEDLIDLISRVSKRELLPEVEKQLKTVDGRMKQVDEKVAQTTDSVAESQRRETIKALAAAVPNWEQQNEDPNFLEWLGQSEPSVGVQRGRLLTDAFRSNDADRVIWFFKSFHSENAAATTEATPEQQAQEQQPKLDDYVAPGTPKTGTASAPNEGGKRVWTRADIQRLYAEKNEFVKKGKKVPERLEKLERDLFKAQTEGRLR